MQYVIEIKGMHCAHCAAAVTKALGAIEGVDAVNVDFMRKIAFVDAKSELAEAVVSAVIDDVGFDFLSMQKL